MKKVFVMMGAYGSGKTELSLNFALEAAGRGRTEIVDLDMVNTYFRLSERRRIIEASEIRLVSPNFANTNIETLSLPAEVASAFDMDWDTVVFDAGGDPVGATALGRFKMDFLSLEPGALEVLHVVNVQRPMSSTPEEIIEDMQGLMQTSRLEITGFVNNANVGVETGERDLPLGYEALREVSERTGIPVLYTTGKSRFLRAFLASGPDMRFVGRPVEIKTYMHRDWDTYIHKGLFDQHVK